MEAAADLAGKLHLELWIVSVTESVSPEALEIVNRERLTIGDALTVRTNRILAKAREKSQRCGVETIHLSPGWGEPAETILRVAREMQADEIFVGRRGRGRLEGLLLGSVSQKLAALSPCMITIVP